MNKTEEFRNSIMDASGRVRRAIISGQERLKNAARFKFDYVLGWFYHPDTTKQRYEVKYNPSIGVTCNAFDRGSNGTAHDIAKRIPEDYEWQENPNLLEDLTQ